MNAKTVLKSLIVTAVVTVSAVSVPTEAAYPASHFLTEVSSDTRNRSVQTETLKVEAAVTDLFAAMVNKNSQRLRELTAEKLDYGHSSGTLENKTEFIEAVMNGNFDYISIEPEQQQIRISGDTAIVRHIFVSKGTNDGEPSDIRIGNLMTFQKQNGKWKLLARQAYKL